MQFVFDESASGKNVYKTHIAKLDAHTRAPKGAAREEDRRPPLCLFRWGDGLPSFKGVVESLEVKYTRFRKDGTPVRAEGTLTMKEASKVKARPSRRKAKGDRFSHAPS